MEINHETHQEFTIRIRRHRVANLHNYAGYEYSHNTALRAETRITSGLINATAIGFRAQATQNNSLVLGAISGVNSGIDTNIGIGTTAPKTKLHVAAGKIYVEANGQGVILKSPSGSCFELTVTDAGTLITTAAICP